MSGIETLREQLAVFRAMRPKPRFESRFAGIEDLVLRHGREYAWARNLAPVEPRACFARCYRRATHARSRWIYVEGYAIAPRVGFFMVHAWLARADRPDEACETAWEDAGEGALYLGIAFRPEYVRACRRASRGKSYGVLEAWWMDYPLVTGRTPIEDVMWGAPEA